MILESGAGWGVFKLGIGVLFVSVALSPPLSAQATRLIDPVDPAYQDLRVIVNEGLVTRFSLTQRPLSRAAFASAIDEASRNLARRTQAPFPTLSGDARDASLARTDFLRRLIMSMRERLEIPDSTAGGRPVRPEVALARSLSIDVTRANQPTRLIPSNNGLGTIDGVLNTLLMNRQGRPAADGTSAFFESNHALESRYFAVSATPQLAAVWPTDSAGRTKLRLQELSARFLFRNLALDVGREYVVWGQGRDVGLLNSNNSPPLDQIRVSSEEPFTLPWLLRVLGPTQLSIFYADLGADQNFPHAYTVAYRGSISPTSYLELGVSAYTKEGGQGAPNASITARLIDLFPFLSAGAYNNAVGLAGNFQFSDHYAGFDGRVRLPSLGTSFYWDVLLNDFDTRRLGSVFWDDAGHVFGFDLPRLSSTRKLQASFEYHHTGLRYYEHEQFLSGQTVHRMLTGDPLGPNAQGVYADIDWYGSMQERLGLQLALERRSGDLYNEIPNPFGFSILEHRPKELTARVLANWQLLPERHKTGGLVQLGYERTQNFNFVEGDHLNGLLARVALAYRFR